MKAKELEVFLRDRLKLRNVHRSGENIRACCPAHAEQRPSWGININPPHLHGCFSCNYKGTLRTLLVTRGWTITAINDLIGGHEHAVPNFTLTPQPDEEMQSLAEREREFLNFYSKKPCSALMRYMLHRGINRESVLEARLGFHPLDKRVLFPWYEAHEFHGASGRTVDDGNPVKMQAYFGLKKKNHVYSPIGVTPVGSLAHIATSILRVVLVEGEIDALAVQQASRHIALSEFVGNSVFAIGHGHLSDEQVALFESLPVNTPILFFFDFDTVGTRLTTLAIHEFTRRGFLRLFTANWNLLNSTSKLDPGMLPITLIRQLLSAPLPASYWPELVKSSP